MLNRAVLLTIVLDPTITNGWTDCHSQEVALEPGPNSKRCQYLSYQYAIVTTPHKEWKVSRLPPYRIKMDNLSFSVTDSDISNLFSNLKVKSFRPLGVALSKSHTYVEFEDFDSLAKALHFDRLMFMGQVLRIVIPKQKFANWEYTKRKGNVIIRSDEIQDTSDIENDSSIVTSRKELKNPRLGKSLKRSLVPFSNCDIGNYGDTKVNTWNTKSRFEKTKNDTIDYISKRNTSSRGSISIRHHTVSFKKANTNSRSVSLIESKLKNASKYSAADVLHDPMKFQFTVLTSNNCAEPTGNNTFSKYVLKRGVSKTTKTGTEIKFCEILEQEEQRKKEQEESIEVGKTEKYPKLEACDSCESCESSPSKNDQNDLDSGDKIFNFLMSDFLTVDEEPFGCSTTPSSEIEKDQYSFFKQLGRNGWNVAQPKGHQLLAAPGSN